MAQTIHEDDRVMRDALKLIKLHITEKNTAKNRNLHEAVQMIVYVSRRHGLLQD